jgi:hypothetical protein
MGRMSGGLNILLDTGWVLNSDEMAALVRAA